MVVSWLVVFELGFELEIIIINAQVSLRILLVNITGSSDFLIQLIDSSLCKWLIGFQRCLGSIRYPNGDIYRGQLEQGEPFG